MTRDLIGEDWKAARSAQEEVARLGAQAVPALLDARRTARPAARALLDQALAGIVRVLAEDVARPLQSQDRRLSVVGALGGLGGAAAALADLPDRSIPAVTLEELGRLGAIDAPQPQDWVGKQVRARQARGALALLGPAVTGFLLEVPPLREPAHTALLRQVVGAIYQAERARALAADPAAFRARYAGIVDLAAPLVAAGIRDEDPRVRATFQSLRDEALSTLLAALDAPEHGARAAAAAALFRLGDVARPALQHAAAGKVAGASAHLRAAAERLARRIRLGISPELYRKLGHDFAGYADLPFRERRQRVFELERLGGVDAIPALRALLRQEESLEVRTVAALGLFRQGDPRGAEWLTLHRAGIPLVRLSKRELAAIHMDQGLRHLTLGRFERAEQEFLRVLEVQPTNEIAWYNLACTYSRWGRIDQAIEHLQRAVEYGFDDASHMSKDPDLDPLRRDPRFVTLLEQLRARTGEPEGEQGDDEADPLPLEEPER